MTVSIIMPTYNAKDFLPAAIESIIAQTYNDWELLIVDDNSIDGTLDIIKKYTSIDSRIKYVKGKSKGISVALNDGIKQAQGKYIARMDADDIAVPSRLKIQTCFMEDHPEIGVCGTLAVTFDENGKEELWGNEKNRLEYPHYLNQLEDTVVCHPTVMFRKMEFERLGLKYNEEYKTAEDQELWSRAIRYLAFYNIQEVLHRYRIHSMNASAVKKTDGNINLAKVYTNMINWLMGNNKCNTENVMLYREKLLSVINVSTSLFNQNENIRQNSMKFIGYPVWKRAIGLFLFNRPQLRKELIDWKNRGFRR